MSSAIEQVLTWSQCLPSWQSDAVRRLLCQEIEESDIAELLAMLKEKHGLGDNSKPAPTVRPFKKGDVSGAPAKIAEVVLKRIAEIENVNALPDKAHLDCGHQGMTVVYGDNGTGKSGYARILKRACRARDRKELIHPNVYNPKPSGRAKAILKICTDGGPDQEIRWTDGEEPADVLANISVFDGKCARVIVDENNEVTYLPYGATAFGGLVDVLKTIRERLTVEKPVVAPPEYADIAAATLAGQFLARISMSSKLDGWDWTAGDEENLGKLRLRIAKAESEDPAKGARRLRSVRDRMQLLVDQILLVEQLLGESREAKIRKDVTGLHTAEKAFAIAEQEFRTLKSELLPGFGEGPWQLLYAAAKDYALQAAYPEREFPHTEDGSQCVLCQQVLGSEAQARMRRFKDYMEQSAKNALESAKERVAEHISIVTDLSFTFLEDFKDAVGEMEARREGTESALATCSVDMETRARTLLELCIKETPAQVAPIAKWPREAIEGIVKALGIEAEQVEKTAAPEELARLRKEMNELTARKLLVERKPALQRYIEYLVTKAKYERCLAETDSRAISTDGRRIVSEALTPQLMARLTTEINGLGAAHIPLNLRPSGVQGETKHKMELAGSRCGTKANLTDILSEGEQRVVALAGFLAELALAEHKCPIVLDDPVCSLDHVYREKIACRLAKEAKDRQVIVFTHDIAFLLELEEQVAALGDGCFLAQTVRRSGKHAGEVVAGITSWHAMKYKARLAHLEQNLLPEIKRLYNKDSPVQDEEYNSRAGELYGRLRECWECFIEDELLAATVKRHRKSVQTQQLRYVTVETEDYRRIDAAMTKCSGWMIGHDKSKALNESRPTPLEIMQDILSLRDAAGVISTRKNQVERDRTEAIQPRRPNAG